MVTIRSPCCGYHSRRLYILCWSELSPRKLSPTLATPRPTTLVLTTLVAQCELSRRKIGLLLEVVGRKLAHRPGNPATVGVVRWPAAGDTAGSSLRRLNSLQHRIYNLLDITWHGVWRQKPKIYGVIRIKLNQLVYENDHATTSLPVKRIKALL